MFAFELRRQLFTRKSATHTHVAIDSSTASFDWRFETSSSTALLLQQPAVGVRPNGHR